MNLEWGRRTYIMGIVNVTPDSFSGDGVLAKGDWLAQAVVQAHQFVADGADILDIGGESTRPGSVPVTEEEEYQRVIPAIQAIRQAVGPEVIISVDTYRAKIARAALQAGANWVNDVWGLQMDPEMAGVIVEAGCPVVLMHNRSKPKDALQEERLGGRYIGIAYKDLIIDVRREMRGLVNYALKHGIRAEQIILDPGIGFGKSVDQNIQLLRELYQFKSIGYPLLVGTSRKSFIGYTLNLPPEERLEGTAATIAMAIARGADIVRVHDVREMARVVKMTDKIVRY